MAATLPLYRAADARAIDRQAIEGLGIPGYALMTRAGEAAWRLLRERWPQAQRLGVACGPGNNGGDGYVLARLAREAGLAVRLVALAPPSGPDAERAMAEWTAVGGRSEPFDGALPAVDLPDVELWVDAVFGTGLSRAPEGAAAALIAAVDAAGAPVLALDVPSGVDADTGAVPGAAVHADLTLSFICAKRGLFTGPALDCVGEQRLDPLEVPVEAFAGCESAALSYRAAALRDWLRPRRRGAHKGAFGHVLCIGGNEGTGGAIALCAQAALRVGAGLISVATRAAHVPAILAGRPEAMARAVEDSADFAPLLGRATVLALGPGLGQGDWGRALWTAALAAGKPTVLDADALNLLAARPRPLPAAVVLTPHPGEAARLLDAGPAAVQADRFAAAQALAERFAATVVLKGAGTVVAAPGQKPALIAAGNPGMAAAGMGDVLTGVIAALLAQGLAPFQAAACGALLHAAAGDAAAADGERGLIASDLFAPLRRLANPNG